MKIYLVGGAVRDQLLNLPHHDNDWVVVGATPEQMIKQGFRAVGQDFPVFLHPKTQEEYALARTERKSGHGYKGFECYFSEDVTLEEDLVRRDLTINAIAQDKEGEIYDPYHGQQDLEQRILRHVSPAFSEDPLRVLRVARFAAQLAPLGFSVAPETLALMQQMADSGELAHLTAERVWQEWQKSLLSPAPQAFIQVLRDCGALKVILPEIDALFGVPQTAKWHPEIDAGIHTLLVTEQLVTGQAGHDAEHLSDADKIAIRFAGQLHDLGKAITPKEEWPSHKMHEIRGLPLVKGLCERIKVPNDCRELALLVCEFHLNFHNVAELKSSTVIKLLNKMDAWRKPERFKLILLVCQADSQGRTGFEDRPYPQRQLMLEFYHQANKVDVQSIIAQGFEGQQIRDELHKQRIKMVKKYKATLGL